MISGNYTECSKGTNRPPLDEFDKWADWCEHAPLELLQLDCNKFPDCQEFLNCVDNKN